MYQELVNAINLACTRINLKYSTKGDGRLTSAIKETEYLCRLEEKLKEINPLLVFKQQPVDRWWWDFSVNDVPFNLKLTF